MSLMLIRRGMWSDSSGCFVRGVQLVLPSHCTGAIVISGKESSPFTLFLVKESVELSAMKLFSIIQLSQSSDMTWENFLAENPKTRDNSYLKI